MIDPTTTKRVGLFTTGETCVPVPLAGVSIEAEICGFYARAVVAHRYVNREKTPIEAVYVFPLEEGAAICGFEAVVAGTLVVGEVQERDRAFEMYDDAMEEGHGAFLLDEERPDVFQASVGNLLPGQDVTVKLTYVTELAADHGHLRFAIPTTVSPRYAPAEDTGGVGRADAQALNPPVMLSVPYGLTLSIDVVMPGGVTAIESPSHPIALRMSDRGATVSLTQADAALDRDFILSIEAPGLDSPHALVERAADGTEALGVAFAPRFAATSAAAELIFLVDRSGSMEGRSMDEVRKALQLCLRSITPGCRFNIVGFGSTYETLFAESRAYDQASLEAASAYTAGLLATLGGTELLPALRFVLEKKGHAALPRQVVVLTDGEVTNTDAVIALAAAHAPDARIFTFGIGAGASHHLLRGLARAGGGSAEFIYPGERIEPKVLRQLARLLSPALTDVRIEWVGGTVAQAPSKIPPVFAGGRLLVYGFVHGHRPTHARLTARGPSGALSFEVPVPDVAGGSGRTVATLAARARIRELEEGSDWLSARGSQQTDRKATGARNEIIALSLRYGLMSRETSFVAIERRDTPVTGEVALRRVPLALTTGWGGLPQSVASVQIAQSRLPAAFANTMWGGGGRPGARFGAPLSRSGAWPGDDASDDEDSRPTGFRRPPTASAAPPPLSKRRVAAPPSDAEALILLQAANGSWELSGELAAILGRDLAELRSAVTGATGAEAEIRRAWATALALAWLGRNAADRADEWRLLAGKAERWMDATTARPPGGRPWAALANELLVH